MSLTIVTSLINIRRDKWTDYTRSWEEYKMYMANILKMDVPFVIYVEKDTEQFVRNCRSKYPQTEIVTITIEDYKLFSKLRDIERIQSDPAYKQMCIFDATCPEVIVPLYDVVVNNKIDFMSRASSLNPFRTEYFVWLDAGYGHCKFNIPEGHIPDFRIYTDIASQNKIVINKLKDKMSSEDYLQFFKDHQDFFDGGLVVGNAGTIAKFHELYYSLIDSIMEKNIIDDDQYFMAMAYAQNKNLVHPVKIPDWSYRVKIILG